MLSYRASLMHNLLGCFIIFCQTAVSEYHSMKTDLYLFWTLQHLTMQLWILTLACKAVSGVSRISELDWDATNFAKAVEGKKLNGSVIKEIEVNSETVCQFECVREVRCKSYNFRKTKTNGENFKCQLSDSDRFSGIVNFTEDEDFIYRGPQVN